MQPTQRLLESLSLSHRHLQICLLCSFVFISCKKCGQLDKQSGHYINIQKGSSKPKSQWAPSIAAFVADSAAVDISDSSSSGLLCFIALVFPSFFRVDSAPLSLEFACLDRLRLRLRLLRRRPLDLDDLEVDRERDLDRPFFVPRRFLIAEHGCRRTHEKAKP